MDGQMARVIEWVLLTTFTFPVGQILCQEGDKLGTWQGQSQCQLILKPTL